MLKPLELSALIFLACNFPRERRRFSPTPRGWGIGGRLRHDFSSPQLLLWKVQSYHSRDGKKKKKNHLIKGSRGVLSTVRRSALEESVEINNAFKTCFETCTKD